MPGWSGAFREDWTGSGFFGFQSTGVQYSDTGIRGLRQSIYFDQGPWFKQDETGTSLAGQQFDATTYRIGDRLTAISVATGVGSYHLYRRMRLPRDFGKWSIVSFFTKKSGTVANFTSATLSLYRNGISDPAIDSISILPVTADTWEAINEAPSAVYFPGDFITLAVNVRVQAVAADGPVFQMADFGATYITDKVNI